MSEPGLTRVVGCPCGEVHTLSREAWAAFRRVTADLDPVARIKVAGLGAWKVPRIYAALHGLSGADLPRLASQYGWEQA